MSRKFLVLVVAIICLTCIISVCMLQHFWLKVSNLEFVNYINESKDCHEFLSRWLDNEGVVTDFSSIHEVKRQAAFRIFKYISKKSKISLNESRRNDTVFHITTMSSSLVTETLKSSPTLAFVLPFTRIELPKIEEWLTSFRAFPPCESTVNGAHLVWAFADDFDSADGRVVKSTIAWLLRKYSESSCFESHKFISMRESHDMKRLDGACTTFFKLFQHLHTDYTAMQIVETDIRPITNNWLHKYLEFADLPGACGSWWMKGSASKCDTNYAPPEEIDLKFDLHINGNALYALRCPEFHQFLHRLQQFFPVIDKAKSEVKMTGGCNTGIINEGGYDHAIYRYLRSSENFVYSRWIVNKFMYTDFVSNFCEDIYNLHDVKKKSKDVALVHSKSSFLGGNTREIFELFYKLAKRTVQFSEIKNHFLLLLPLFQSNELDKHSAEALFAADPRFKYSLKKLKSVYNNYVKTTDWSTAFPNKTYIWTSDFHYGPISCQLPILKAIGAVTHPEIDYGNCIYGGYCKDRLKVLSVDNMMGFALKSSGKTPKQLKREFYEEMRDDPEFKRVDAVYCSHPAANCELYMKLNKPLIVYFTTRMEFGRCDKGINWRWPAWNDKDAKVEWSLWVDNLIKISQSRRNLVIANNLYDANYVKFFTGIDVTYIPSWCGDVNYVYDNLRSGGSVYLAKPGYRPNVDTFLIGPYRTNLGLHRNGSTSNEADHPIMRELLAKSTRVRTMSAAFPKGFAYSALGGFKGIVLLPYQVSTIFILEVYRMNLPLFCPSHRLLIEWHSKFPDFMWERIYGWPKHLQSKILRNSGNFSANIPNPNDNSHESFAYWTQFADWYTFPHVMYFDSIDDLIRRTNSISSAELFAVSQRMEEHNNKERSRLQDYWRNALAKLKAYYNPNSKANYGYNIPGLNVGQQVSIDTAILATKANLPNSRKDMARSELNRKINKKEVYEVVTKDIDLPLPARQRSDTSHSYNSIDDDDYAMNL